MATARTDGPRTDRLERGVPCVVVAWAVGAVIGFSGVSHALAASDSAGTSEASVTSGGLQSNALAVTIESIAGEVADAGRASLSMESDEAGGTKGVTGAGAPEIGAAGDAGGAVRGRSLGSPLGRKAGDKAGRSDTTAGRTDAGADGKDQSSVANAILKNDVVRTALSLALVLALIAGMAVVAKKLGARRAGSSLASALGAGGVSPSGVMEVLGRYPVARGQSLVLLRIHRRVLLMSHTVPSLRLRSGGTGGFVTLAEFTDPEEVAGIILRANEQQSETMTAKFRSILGKFDTGYEDAAMAAERPDHRVRAESTPSDLRLIRANGEGDRAELWDDRAVVGRASEVAAVRASPRGETASMAAERPFGGAQEDPMGSLRHRLAGLRGRGVQG